MNPEHRYAEDRAQEPGSARQKKRHRHSENEAAAAGHGVRLDEGPVDANSEGDDA